MNLNEPICLFCRAEGGESKQHGGETSEPALMRFRSCWVTKNSHLQDKYTSYLFELQLRIIRIKLGESPPRQFPTANINIELMVLTQGNTGVTTSSKLGRQSR